MKEFDNEIEIYKTKIKKELDKEIDSLLENKLK